MIFFPCRTLAQKLAAMATKDKNIEEKEILQIFQQIVAAIRHIHELNILHRYIGNLINTSQV